MAEQWISASKALEIAKDEFALCSRLHAGLIVAWANLLIIDHKKQRDAKIPQRFWWAEDHGALKANWQSGDFETWIDGKVLCKAFGVSMALSGVLEFVAFEKRALIARSLSVAGDPDWISAKEARALAFQRTQPAIAGKKIIELARLGFISGRAVILEAYRQGRSHMETLSEEREWNIPPWFWKEFTLSGKSAQDWEIGKFSGSGNGPNMINYVVLSGVHFQRESMAALDGPKATPPETQEQRRGRRTQYDWPGAISAVWGKLHRGELNPQVQADIEQALILQLTVGDDAPGESTVRPYAKPIWEEYQKP